MHIEEQVREAMIAELQRQAEARPTKLKVSAGEKLTINGEVEIEELVMAVVGALAGGP